MGRGQRDRVAVVVDSAASLPAGAELGDGSQLYVVPMQLIVEGKTYLDGRDLSSAEFYRMLKGVTELPTTSAPSPESFVETFRSAAANASSILCLTVSRNVSSCYGSAETAMQIAGEAQLDAQIVALDTESAAGGEGLVAMEAWRAAKRGATLDEAVAAARAVIPRVSLIAFLDTLYYVWRSGRVRRLAHTATSLLRIKSMFELRRGEIRNIGRPRTGRRAMDRLVTLMRREVGRDAVHATVIHADAGEQAEQLRQRVESEFRCEELYTSEFSPVMGAHTGPGLLGIAFWSEDGLAA